MKRRDILKSFFFLPLLGLADSSSKKVDNEFKISMFGDLDDDLIIIKATENKNLITDIHQMHNSKGTFIYDGDSYQIENNIGIIQFSKKYKINEDEVYSVFLANEMDDMEYPINKRIRTHYKNEKLFYNKEIFLKHLMPEYDSVPNYPLWFNQGDAPLIDRLDVNGNTYNYYNLFENTVVQCGLVFPQKGKVQIMLFNHNNELKYTYEENIDKTPKYLKSNELKNGNLENHPFVEVGNILNKSTNEPIDNNEYLTHMLIVYQDKQYNIKFPYPAMYPNLISAVSVN
ncbi:hypothetical protein ACOTVS_11200 [Aliarcobacter butzleri]|uniref:hypothetical protein n=1 Tax=Aliarcobacter butzleri TaxID=28197 RepID=UPI00344D846A